MRIVNLLFVGRVFAMCLAMGLMSGAAAQTAPTKIGVVDLQSVIIKTKEGEKAAADLKAKFAPKQVEFEKKQQEIAGMQTQLRNGQNTMSEENKQKLMREIDQKNNLLKRDTEDANADLEQEQQRVMGELVPKIVSVLNKYATENGFALVLDISSQQTPVLFASNAVELTRDLISAYDKSSAMTTPTQPKMSTPPPAGTPPPKPIVK
jgi:outer membrane protein